MLGYFKYYNFFIDNISALLKMNNKSLQIALPVGMSFYVFSAISYMVDVYREKYSADKSFLNVVLYICFFPKLMSGPIVRADKFLPQLNAWNSLRIEDFKTGIQMFVIGMFKKMVLADHLGVFVDNVFYAPTAYSSLTVIWATVTYSLQIYFDFSGYSDMAIGISRMLGFRFDNNFNYPYLSKNLTEFWKRWHISLSSWLQEYLYIPLGGNRKGRFKTYINLFLTMLIGGLWHGADWSFVLWGVLHGVGLIIHKMFREWKKILSEDVFETNKIWEICSIIFTFIYVNFCWIFFRADNIQQGIAILKQIIAFTNGINQPYTWTMFAILLLMISSIMVLKNVRDKKISAIELHYPVIDMDSVIGLSLFWILCGLTIGMAYYGNTAFIYDAF